MKTRTATFLKVPFPSRLGVALFYRRLSLRTSAFVPVTARPGNRFLPECSNSGIDEGVRNCKSAGTVAALGELLLVKHNLSGTLLRT